MRGFITLTSVVRSMKGYVYILALDGDMTLNVDHIVGWSRREGSAGAATEVTLSTGAVLLVSETPAQITSILHAALGGHAVETP